MTQLKQNANHWWSLAAAMLLLIATATCNAQTFRGGIGSLSFTHNFLRYEESDLYVSEACKSAP